MIKSHKKTIYEILGRESIHPFPARMAPGIALEVLGESKRSLRILDPMMGSGTVLAIGRAKGHRVIGVDIDPLAVLITTVWSTAVDADKAKQKALEVLDRARIIFQDLPYAKAYPRNANPETRAFVRYWFDSYARRQLAALAIAISRVRNESIRNVLWCGFSRLIITKQSGASLAMDLSHSRPHKVFDYAPSKPFSKFLASVDRVVDNCISRKSSDRGPAPRIYRGDARHLPVATGSVDLVLTSPPYLNAIDYVRCSKFSLVWMGYSIHDLRALRAASIGTEGARGQREDEEIRNILTALELKPKMRAKDQAVLSRYINDMRCGLREVARVLTPGGKAVYVIGENTIRGTYIRNSAIVTTLAELTGLKFRKRRTRNIPANRRYLPPPTALGSDSLNGRMRREVVLAFERMPRAA